MAGEEIKGTVNTGTGTFKPDPAVPGPRLNPFINPSAWGRLSIGGLDVGFVTDIDGCEKPEEWSVQKGTGSSGATIVWKGTKLAEGITIGIAIMNRDAFETYCNARDALRPKIGTKPPSLLIVNAKVNWSGITRIACVDVTSPKWVPGGSYWTGSIKVSEYNPSKKTNTGPAGPAKAGAADKAKAPTANDQAAAELDAAIKKAAALS